MLALAGSACAVVVLAYARANGIPRIEGSQLGAVTYTATCRDDTCRVAIAAETTSGESTSIPQASTLTFGCGSDDAALHRVRSGAARMASAIAAGLRESEARRRLADGHGSAAGLVRARRGEGPKP